MLGLSRSNPEIFFRSRTKIGVGGFRRPFVFEPTKLVCLALGRTFVREGGGRSEVDDQPVSGQINKGTFFKKVVYICLDSSVVENKEGSISSKFGKRALC